jgi:hypothetical protein
MLRSPFTRADFTVKPKTTILLVVTLGSLVGSVLLHSIPLALLAGVTGVAMMVTES